MAGRYFGSCVTSFHPTVNCTGKKWAWKEGLALLTLCFSVQSFIYKFINKKNPIISRKRGCKRSFDLIFLLIICRDLSSNAISGKLPDGLFDDLTALRNLYVSGIATSWVVNSMLDRSASYLVLKNACDIVSYCTLTKLACNSYISEITHLSSQITTYDTLSHFP